MAPRSVWYLGLAVAVVALVGPGTTRAQPVAPGGNNPWLTLLPALRTAPAPGWLRQGTRITYYVAAASIQGGRHSYREVPDPNPASGVPCIGLYMDPVTKKCYEQSEVGQGSGHGYSQVTVLALDQRVAAVEVRLYVISGASGPAVLGTTSGYIELPGVGGDTWLNPQVLRGAAGLKAAGLRVAQVRYPINGRPYNALWIQSGGPGAGQTWVYDLDTGVLLHGASATQGAPIQGPVAQGESREGATQLSQSTLVGVRTPTIPWAAEPAPDWVGRTSILRYQGSVTHYINVGGAAPASLALSVTFQRQNAGYNWAQYVVTTDQPGSSVPSMPAHEVRMYGSGQFGGLWVPPRWLVQLRPGQALDTDPVTGVTVSVGQAGRSPQGVDVVTITEANQALRTDSAYDRATGMLVYFSQFNTESQNRLQLQLVQRQ